MISGGNATIIRYIELTKDQLPEYDKLLNDLPSKWSISKKESNWPFTLEG